MTPVFGQNGTSVAISCDGCVNKTKVFIGGVECIVTSQTAKNVICTVGKYFSSTKFHFHFIINHYCYQNRRIFYAHSIYISCVKQS